MNLAVLIYLISMLDTISVVFSKLAAFWAIYTVAHMLPGLDDTPSNFGKYMKKSLTFFRVSVFFILFMTASLIPSSKVAAAMYVIPKLVNNETMQQVPDAVKNLFEIWAKEIVKEKESGR